MGWEKVPYGKSEWWRRGEDDYIPLHAWDPLEYLHDAFQIAEKLCIAIVPQSGAPAHMKFMAYYDDTPIGPESKRSQRLRKKPYAMWQ
jgi:hypothetical protein